MLFKGSATKYEKPQPGSYEGVCFRVIDLGTQEGSYQGVKNFKPKVMISWELAEKMKDGKQFVVNMTLTKSLHENSALRAHLEGWRGKSFTEEEIETFDEKKILGKACLLNLVAKDEYINVKTVSALPKGMEAHALLNKIVTFSLDPGEFSQDVFDGLHDKIKSKVMASPEWAKLKGVQHDGHDDAPPQESEEVPF